MKYCAKCGHSEEDHIENGCTSTHVMWNWNNGARECGCLFFVPKQAPATKYYISNEQKANLFEKIYCALIVQHNYDVPIDNLTKLAYLLTKSCVVEQEKL